MITLVSGYWAYNEQHTPIKANLGIFVEQFVAENVANVRGSQNHHPVLPWLVCHVTIATFRKDSIGS